MVFVIKMTWLCYLFGYARKKEGCLNLPLPGK
nr:MAG TPA: hypothetical protein [Caudoviricetes sp.]